MNDLVLSPDAVPEMSGMNWHQFCAVHDAVYHSVYVMFRLRTPGNWDTPRSKEHSFPLHHRRRADKESENRTAPIRKSWYLRFSSLRRSLARGGEMASSKQTLLQIFPSATIEHEREGSYPLVLLNICDCYVRRPDQADRVIGTLLDSIFPDGTVEIKNSYAVPTTSPSTG